ncbi:MAG: hypothetical protein APF81_00010 [Desulfosporosinus sp. BRH_c37]|nr:MAG: hypothetical protein APF81_00010 [Desulfosporosinus sp. BRH_c37]
MPKKANGTSKGGRVTQEQCFQWINGLKNKCSIYSLCLSAQVSRSGYYKWLKRQSSALNSREQENQQIGLLLRQGYQHVKGRYGYRRMKIWLEREHGIQVNHKRVYRLLKSMELQSLIRRKKKRRKKEEQFAPNVLNRQFKADQPFQKLVTDITYVYAGSRRFYLSVIQDLFNNEIVAYHLSDQNDTDLVLQTLEKALEKGDVRGVLLHSDQGHQYTSNLYHDVLQSHQIIRSMSRRANCWDNAVVESFFSHFKTEGLWLERPRTLDELHMMIDNYIHFYNIERFQEKLGNLSPIEYRKAVA